MATIADVRAEYPFLADQSDDEVVDALHQAFYPDLPRDRVAQSLGVKPTEPPAPPSGSMRRLVADSAISLGKGAIAVPEEIVGLANLVTGGYAGKLAEQAGVRFKDAKAFLDDYYSPEQKAANKAVQDASQGDGDFLDKVGRVAKAAVTNPSVIVHSALESLPSMAAGGVVGRGAIALAPKLAPAIAGGIGEGVVTAGQQAEQTRQETPDGLLTPKQALLTGGSGFVTGAIGAASNRLAQKLGIENVETLLAGGHADPVAKAGLVRRVIGGAVTEGLLEELPQSVQEQVAQNMALGKPLDEGVDQAAVLGVLTGGAMGMGAQAFHGKSHGDVIREDLQPGGGPLATAVNAGVEAAAREADANAPRAPGPVAPRLADANIEAAIRKLDPDTQDQALGLYQLGNRADVNDSVRLDAQRRLDALLAPAAEPVKVEAPVEAEQPKPRQPVALPVAPDVQDRVNRAFDIANGLGLTDRVEELSASGLTAPKILEELGPALDPVRADAAVKGEDADAAARAFVDQLRKGLGVPSQDEPEKFKKWQTEFNQRRLDAAAEGQGNDGSQQPAGAGANPSGTTAQPAAPVGTGVVARPEPDGGPSARPVAEPVARAAAVDSAVRDGAERAALTEPATVPRGAEAVSQEPKYPNARTRKIAERAAARAEPSVDALAQRQADAPVERAGDVRPGDILASHGSPFGTMPAALRALAKAGEGAEIVKVSGGLVVRPKVAASTNAEAPATSGSERVAPAPVASAPEDAADKAARQELEVQAARVEKLIEQGRLTPEEQLQVRGLRVQFDNAAEAARALWKLANGKEEAKPVEQSGREQAANEPATDGGRSSEEAKAGRPVEATPEQAVSNRKDAGETVPAVPHESPTAAANDEPAPDPGPAPRPENLIELRKRASVLDSLLKCLA